MAALVGEMVRVWGGSVSKGWSVVDGGWQVTRGGVNMLEAVLYRCGLYELLCMAWCAECCKVVVVGSGGGVGGWWVMADQFR